MASRAHYWAMKLFDAAHEEPAGRDAGWGSPEEGQEALRAFEEKWAASWPGSLGQMVGILGVMKNRKSPGRARGFILDGSKEVTIPKSIYSLKSLRNVKINILLQ